MEATYLRVLRSVLTDPIRVSRIIYAEILRPFFNYWVSLH
jgi:hypothetical protein